MKHLYALALIACASTTITAQPTLLNTEMAPIGTVVNMRIMETFSAIDETIQGPNAVWDFTGLAPDLTAAQFILQLMAPASTPNGNLFPTANLAWKELPNNYYRYFNLSSTKMERVGSYTTTAKNYSDPQVEYVFPMALGTTNSDTWATQTSYGTYDLTCVGYGTLLLPGNTYNDVLMVHVDASEQGIFNYDVYFWYSSTNGITLVQYIPDGILAESGLFVESTGIGMEEMDAPAALLSTMPIDGQLMLRFDRSGADLGYTLSSVSGTQVGGGSLATVIAGEVMAIPVGELAPGVYLMSLSMGEQRTKAMRFVVQ